MQVRFLDWAEAAAAESSQAVKGPGSTAAAPGGATSTKEGQRQAVAPHVQSDELFEVIIGTDILYEVNSPWVLYIHQFSEQLLHC